MTEPVPAPRRRAIRRLRRESDGALFDSDERRRIELDELADDVRAGRYFRAVRHTSGQDCTHEVLAEVLAAGVARPTGAFASLGDMVGTAFGTMAGGVAGHLLDVRSEGWSRDRDDLAPGRAAENGRASRERRARESVSRPNWWEER